MLLCSAEGCGRRYHDTCAHRLPNASFEAEDGREEFVCPLHSCANCTLGPSTGIPLVRCVHCPVAYHTTCIPAGCELIVSEPWGLLWGVWKVALQGSASCPTVFSWTSLLLCFSPLDIGTTVGGVPAALSCAGT